jgi:predicted DsbA family dithiol-disulfide isomerase
MMRPVKLVYFLDVLSSWCLVAEDALDKVRREFGDRLDYEWRIAALHDAFNYSPEQMAFYYRRTHHITNVRLNPVWLESTADGSKWANIAAEAARGLGCTDDRVRLALAKGAMIDTKHMSKRDVVVETAAKAGGLDRVALEQAMDDPTTAARIRASSEEFAKYNVDVRPTFVVRNAIADTSVLSGCWRYDLLAQAVRSALDDQDRFDAFMADNRAPAGAV